MDIGLLLLFAGLFCLSAFFSASEIAFMSLGPHTIESLRKQRRKNAASLVALIENKERLLITILIGNNLVNVYTAALAAQISIGIAMTTEFDEATMIAVASALITLLILLFGEVFPKTVASRYASDMALLISPFYRVLVFLFSPLSGVIHFLMNRFAPMESTTGQITDDEIAAILDISKEQGIIESDELEKMKQLLDFNETTAEEVMTPRLRIESLKSSISVKDAIESIMEYSHSRIPVYTEYLDDAKYLVTLKQLYRYMQNDHSDTLLQDLQLDHILRVPLTQPINTVLEMCRNEKKHIVLVIDEYGGVAGLVSLEDIIEEVFGEIRDETDIEQESFIKIEPGTWRVSSHVLLEDAIRHIGLEIHGDYIDEYGSETLSYVLMEKLGRFPTQGEKIMLPLFDTDDDEYPEDEKFYLSINVQDIDNGSMGYIIISIVHATNDRVTST